jgi:hypothetical protein
MTTTINLEGVKAKVELPDGGCVVLLDMLGKAGQYSKDQIAKNIFRLDEKGEVKWQVFSDFDSEGSPFTRIDLQNGINAYRWDGGTYSVNIETGEATPLQLER